MSNRTDRRGPDDHTTRPGLGTDLSARRRITGWILATTALALIVLLLTVRSMMITQVENDAHSAIAQESREFRAFAKEGVDPTTAQPFTSIEAMLERYLTRQSTARGEVIIGLVGARTLYTEAVATDQRTITHQLHVDRALLDTIQRGAAPSGVAETSSGELHWARIPVESNGVTGHLVIGEYTKPGLDAVSRTTMTILGVSFGGLLFTSVIAWLVAGQILRPIRDVRTVADEITEKDLTARVPVHGNDDVAALAHTFNSMLDRIEESHRSQRAFVDDASHELRTPITVIRGHLELIEDNPVERRRTLALVDDELSRMGRIVTDLLMLAKAERPGFVNARPTEIADLMLDIEAKAQVLGDRGWPLLAIAEGQVALDPQRITQAVLQLASNACQYSPEGSTVSLGSAFEREDGRRVLKIWVTDHGRGVAQEDAEHIFDRFRRGSSIATSEVARAGAGLGLAIVQTIADAHHGSAWVRSTPGQGATFGVSLPATAHGQTEHHPTENHPADHNPIGNHPAEHNPAEHHPGDKTIIEENP